MDYAKSHDNVTLLLGNHDLVYWFPYNWEHKMAGWEEDVIEILRYNMCILHLFAERDVDGKRWLFSHAPLFEEWHIQTTLTTSER